MKEMSNCQAKKLISKVAVIVLCTTLLSCRKEAAVARSGQETFDLTVSDNPADSVDHRIFLFYQQTGIAAYYNDTLVSDDSGSPVRLATAYSPLGVDGGLRFSLLDNRSQIPALLDFINERLLSRLPQAVSIPSILFVQSLSRVQSSDFPLPVWAYRGFNTLIIKVVNLDTLIEKDKQQYLGEILGALIGKRILTGEQSMQTWYKKFLQVSNELRPLGVYNRSMADIAQGGPPADPKSYGFIRYYEVDGNEYTPSEALDLESYISAAFAYTTEEFAEMYSDFPVVIEKFTMVRTMLETDFP